MKNNISILALLLACTFFLVSAFAGGPVFWRIGSRAEIEKGDASGISVADNGTLMLAPTYSEIYDTKQAYIWATASDNAGNIYLGTGHEGRVFKVDAAGKGSLLYKTAELDVMALAIDNSGNVYAGSSPDGKVYKITPKGDATVFFEPKTKYIWSMAFDTQGRLLIGTGDKGVIHRVTPDGKGSVLIKTTQANITSLRVDNGGNIIAGTDPGGLVLRVSPEGKAFTLFDSAQREVRDLAIGKEGEIYALALAESAGSGASNTASAGGSSSGAPTVLAADEGVTVTISDVQIIDSSSSATTATTSTKSTGDSAKSALYRIDAIGVTDVLWDSRDVVAFGLTLDDAGRALIGTGQKGRIYSVTADPNGIRNPTLLAQSADAQTSRFVQVTQNGKAQIYAASSNLGKLYRLGTDTVGSGTFISPARDAQTVGTWGRINWTAEGDVELQTRSGNTSVPDSTWSDWSEAYGSSDGSRNGAAITSPRARFIQWRATLKKSAQSASPKLREVTVSYLPRNLAPSLGSISMLPTGVALQALPQQPSDSNAEQSGLDPSVFGAVAQLPPRRLYQRGAISLQWQAEDRNSDTLEYTVFYRNAAGGEYFPLKTGMRDAWYTVDANALPDGRYIFKVVATDAPSNPAGLAMTDEQETEIIEVDNTAPVISASAPQVSGGKAEVTFTATDATSFIRRAEYQLDGGAWKAVYPSDGIADSRREEFKVNVTLPDAKPHVMAFRVFDANTNVGSTQAVLK
jgi:hypothetical protein